MNRRAFITGLGAVLAARLSAEAQQVGKVARIGFLSLSSGPTPSMELAPGLRELGWVDGQNIAIEYRWAADREEQLPALAAELVQLKVDIIVTSSTPAARAEQATTTVPIVITFVADPVGSGLVASLARPGGNITGVSTLARGLVTKRLELLRAVVPKSQRIGVLWQPGAHGERTIRELMEETKAASGALGLQLEFVEARRADDLELAFSRMSNAHIDGVLVFPSPMLFDVRESLVAHAAKVRLPAVYSWREAVDAEGSCLTLRTFQTCTAAQQFTWTRS